MKPPTNPTLLLMLAMALSGALAASLVPSSFAVLGGTVGEGVAPLAAAPTPTPQQCLGAVVLLLAAGAWCLVTSRSAVPARPAGGRRKKPTTTTPRRGVFVFAVLGAVVLGAVLVRSVVSVAAVANTRPAAAKPVEDATTTHNDKHGFLREAVAQKDTKLGNTMAQTGSRLAKQMAENKKMVAKMAGKQLTEGRSAALLPRSRALPHVLPSLHRQTQDILGDPTRPRRITNGLFEEQREVDVETSITLHLSDALATLDSMVGPLRLTDDHKIILTEAEVQEQHIGVGTVLLGSTRNHPGLAHRTRESDPHGFELVEKVISITARQAPSSSSELEYELEIASHDPLVDLFHKGRFIINYNRTKSNVVPALAPALGHGRRLGDDPCLTDNCKAYGESWWSGLDTDWVSDEDISLCSQCFSLEKEWTAFEFNYDKSANNGDGGALQSSISIGADLFTGIECAECFAYVGGGVEITVDWEWESGEAYLHDFRAVGWGKSAFNVDLTATDPTFNGQWYDTIAQETACGVPFQVNTGGVVLTVAETCTLDLQLEGQGHLDGSFSTGMGMSLEKTLGAEYYKPDAEAPGTFDWVNTGSMSYVPPYIGWSDEWSGEATFTATLFPKVGITVTMDYSISGQSLVELGATTSLTMRPTLGLNAFADSNAAPSFDGAITVAVSGTDLESGAMTDVTVTYSDVTQTDSIKLGLKNSCNSDDEKITVLKEQAHAFDGAGTIEIRLLIPWLEELVSLSSRSAALSPPSPP